MVLKAIPRNQPVGEVTCQCVNVASSNVSSSRRCSGVRRLVVMLIAILLAVLAVACALTLEPVRW